MSCPTARPWLGHESERFPQGDVKIVGGGERHDESEAGTLTCRGSGGIWLDGYIV